MDISKTIDFFRIPNPYRDLIDLLVGTTALLFLQIFSIIKPLAYLDALGLHTFESDITLLAIAFIIGKFAFIVSDSLTGLFFVTLRQFQNKDVASWWKECKEYSHRLIFNKRPAVKIEEMKDEVAVTEIAYTLQTYPGLSTEIERIVSYNRLVGSYAVLALAVGISDPKYFLFQGSRWALLLALLLFFVDIETNRQAEVKNYMVFRATVKEQEVRRADREALHGDKKQN